MPSRSPLLLVLAVVLTACSGCSSAEAPAFQRTAFPSAPSAEQSGPRAPEAAPDAAPRVAVPDDLPEVDREFRAAWIATVDNIDWPSSRDLPVAQQKEELRAIMDRAAAIGLNAIIFQVRPMADALYESELEPWSEYLTGEQGRAPSPMWDPLQTAIELAHRRGLELHAWFNPYRASHPTQRASQHKSHISRQRPDLVRRYGRYEWIDPGEPEATDHSMAVILDVVRRYDVDGVHLDDYFYPYPENANGRRLQFPDAESYARARAAGETLSRDDWRRQNTDRFVERLYREVKAEKPLVKVGISPFGIWRPGHPAGIRGFDQYAEIYADARKWQMEGWLDYFAPQLYWSISSRGQSFPALLGWWSEQNTADRHLWPGLFDSRVLPDVGTWRPQEILDQVALVERNTIATGTIHFSMKALMPEYGDLGDQLARGPYAEAALVPASPWLDDEAPGAPGVTIRASGEARWALLTPPGEAVRTWIVRERRGDAWTTTLLPGWRMTHSLHADGAGAMPDLVVVSAVDRAGNEGEPTAVEP
ncbi:MAG: family 10 glycosylhydrolase [Bacteroidota bacterium]